LKGLEKCIGTSVVHPTWQKTKPESIDDTHFGWAFAEYTDDYKESEFSSELPRIKPFTSPTGYGSFSPVGCTIDHINGVKYIRNLYEISGDTVGKYTVPILWDKATNTIVNNESSEIIRMLNSEFNTWAEGCMAAHDFYPIELKEKIDEVNEWVYDDINNGVYKCGFAKSQVAYDEAIKNLYLALDRLEVLLIIKNA
jgi:putative glutathione S-transferase